MGIQLDWWPKGQLHFGLYHSINVFVDVMPLTIFRYGFPSRKKGKFIKILGDLKEWNSEENAHLCKNLRNITNSVSRWARANSLK